MRAWLEDRDRSGRATASGKQGEPDTALNQLSRIQDSSIRQDDARFQRQKERFAHFLQGGQVRVIQDSTQAQGLGRDAGHHRCYIPRPRSPRAEGERVGAAARRLGTLQPRTTLFLGCTDGLGGGKTGPA